VPARTSPEVGSTAPGSIRTRQDFARELTLLRERAGLTIRQVAARTGAPHAYSTIGDWCAGRSLPSLTSRDLFVEMLRACKVSDGAALDEWCQAWLMVRKAPGRPPAQEPYRGLASFQVEDAGWFFGREALTAELAQRLDDLDQAGGGIQLVVGPSGAGKSSLLRAGLIPALGPDRLPEAVPRRSALLTPGPCPAQALAEALSQLRASNLGECDGEGNSAPGDARPVIVVDQFEEAFAPYVGQVDRQMFVEALADAAYGPSGALVVLGLRADCYADVLSFPHLTAAVPGQLVVGPMSEAELREAIAAPARKARIDIEDGLVELLLREVAPRSTGRRAAHEAGVLPLLSHALYATWEQGEYRRMTVAGYRAVGGIEGAVAASADAAFQELTSAHRELARRMFLRLVCVAADMADTRRQATIAGLRAACGEAQEGELESVLDRFVAARLVTVDTDTVEISHEALLTAWPQLSEWLDTDRAGLVIGRQLHDAADSWQREDRDPAALYRGTRLAAASEWAARQPDGLPPQAAEFLAASSALRDGEHRRARRRVRRRYQVGAVLAVLVVAAASAGIYARQEQITGDRDRAQALSRLVADEASRLQAHDLPLSEQLALAAYRIFPTPEARSSLLSATALPSAARVFTSSGSAQFASISGDGRLLAAGSSNGRVQLWTISADGRLRTAGSLLAASGQSIVSVAFSPRQPVLVGGSKDGTIYRWDLARPAQPVALSTLADPAGDISTMAISEEGKTLAVGGANGKVYLWDISNPAHASAEAVLTGPAGPIRSVAFAPVGHLLAAGSEDHTVRLWSTADPARPVALSTLRTRRSQVFSVAISPDGRHLAAGTGAEHDIYRWDITSPARPVSDGLPLTGPGSWVNSVSFSPDGATLAAGSSDNQAWLFNTRTRQVTAQLPHPAPVQEVAYHGRSLVTVTDGGDVQVWGLPGPLISGPLDSVFTVSWDAAGRKLGIAPGAGDNTLSVWNLTDPRQPVPQGPPLVNTAQAAFSGSGTLTPDGRTFAGGSLDGTIQLWDISDQATPARIGIPFPAASELIEGIAISGDGRALAASADDGAVHLIDITSLRNPSRLATLPGQKPGYIIYQASFSPDGHLLAAASEDGNVYLWDIADLKHPKRLATLNGFADSALSVAFSRDGHTLAAGSTGGTIQLWDVTDPGRPVRLGAPLTGPVGYINSVSFNPASDVLAAGSGDDTVWLWDLARPRQPAYLATLTGAPQAIFSVAFSPNGQTLAAGSQDRTVRLWDTSPQSAAELVCSTTGTAITPREWAQYVPGLQYQPPCRN
jgi:WD40 repeat protein